MSGLIGFFKDFLPNVCNIDHNRRWEDLSADEKAGVIVPPPVRVAHPSQPDTNNPLLESLSRCSVHPMVEYLPEPLTFRDWHRFNWTSLEEFYSRRLITEKEDMEHDLDHDDDYDDNDDWESTSHDQHDPSSSDIDQEVVEEKEVVNEMALDSQPPISQTIDPEKKKLKQRRKWRIPPLYQAIHSVQALHHLDLRTKDISLDLCRVTKVWRLRETRRGNKYLRSARGEHKERCCVFPGRMHRVVFGHLEDDGPLSPSYKYVVSLEIEPVVVPTTGISSPLRTRKRVIRIFLYNIYAKAVSEWMEEQSIVPHSTRRETRTNDDCSTSYIMSLSKIPAVSIFPHALDPRDWWDQEHVLPYCICLGDASKMAHTRKEGNATILRADSDDMELRLAIASTTTQEPKSTSELVVSKQILLGSSEESDVETPTPSVLLTRWKSYCETGQTSFSDPATGIIKPRPPQSPATATVSTPPQAIPNVSTTKATPILPADREAQNSVSLPQIRTPPNQPPPPVPVKRPIEPMAFEGSAQKRSRGTDSTNILNDTKNQFDTPEYVRLASLMSLYEENRVLSTGCNQFRKVDTYAVVLGFTAPTQTNRGDWMVTATLVDETCTVPVTLVIFVKHFTQLPHFERTGDVVRVHRVVLQLWKGEVQLTGRKESSYVVIRRSQLENENSGATSVPCSWVVVPTATNQYTFEEYDEERSQLLWYWGQQLLREQQTIIHPEHKFTLGEMSNLTEEDQDKFRDRDLIVLVTGKIPYPIEEQTAITACGFLRVWDGTGQHNDPLPIPSEEASKIQREHGDPPSQAVSKVVSLLKLFAADEGRHDEHEVLEQVENAGNNNKDIHLAEEQQYPGALCGKVANVVIWEQAHWNLICDHVPVCTFIRLRNVAVRKWKEQPFQSLMVHSKSWLSPLPDQTCEIRTLLQEHQKRVERNEYNVASGLLPTIINQATRKTSGDHLHASRYSLRLGSGLKEFASRVTTPKVIQHRQHPMTKGKTQLEFSYTGVVRLVEPTLPQFMGNLQVYCIHHKNSTPTYRCAMTVTDESSMSIQVIVPHHLAERIFGVPATVAARGNHLRAAPYDTSAAWDVSLCSALKNGRRYFIMTEIEKMSEHNAFE